MISRRVTEFQFIFVTSMRDQVSMSGNMNLGNPAVHPPDDSDANAIEED